MLDTVCFSEEAGRAVQKDHDIAAKLETLLPGVVDRQQLFQEIQTAKADVSGSPFAFSATSAFVSKVNYFTAFEKGAK